MDKGLTKEIRPAQDAINQESDGVESCCRRLVAAAITQLFSYMVHKGVRYGYVCTGEAFIFVHIPDDPSSVQCALCIPSLNVKATEGSDIQLTAVAQVLAFTVIALKCPRVSQQWHDAAKRLDVWPVEYSEILKQTPPAARLIMPRPCIMVDDRVTFRRSRFHYDQGEEDADHLNLTANQQILPHHHLLHLLLLLHALP